LTDPAPSWMTLRHAKVANRTVADEYFARHRKVESLYQQGKPLPADTIGPAWHAYAANTMLTNMRNAD
jgi:hypothetical protein